MIIYGTRNKQVLKEDILDTCEHCGNSNSMELHIFSRYFHFFWISFFPVKKFGVSQCNHCKQVLKDNEMPLKLKKTYEGYKSNAKTPFWMFIGLFIAAIMIYSVSASIAADNRNTKKYLKNPVKGDVYEIKTPSNGYTLYRIANVTKDSIYFDINSYESDLQSGLEKLKDKSNDGFSGIIEGYSINEVNAMYAKDRIEKITR